MSESEVVVSVARFSPRCGVSAAWRSAQLSRGLSRAFAFGAAGLTVSLAALFTTGCSGGNVTLDPGQADIETLADAALPAHGVASSSHSQSRSAETSSAELPAPVTQSENGETSNVASSDTWADAGNTSETLSSSALSSSPLSSDALSSLAVDGGFGDWTGDGATPSESSLLSYPSGDAGGVTSASSEGDAGPEQWDGPPITARSGFIDIAPISYVRHNFAQTSSAARLFYSFRPADSRPDSAPTFVFFNGGPGYATSLGLMLRGTGPVTVGSPQDSSALVENPWSWSQLGNLLYIDTRLAGFSYSTLSEPSNSAARQAEDDDHNFNDYLDAADLIRVMLRVLASTPGVQDNPIVLVGESYGGVRATMMLAFLLNHDALRATSWYTDATLADEIEAHYAAVGDNYADPRDQFPAQVLIQPFIAGTQFADQAAIACLPGSKEQLIAEEQNLDCEDIRYLRDAYNIDEVSGWSDWLDVVAGAHITNLSSLPSLLGVDPIQIVGLSATDRAGAFRLGGPHPPPQAEFEDALGVLQPWDAYHIAFNSANFNADVYDNPYPCVYFSRVISRVATFVTDADADMVVDTPALPTTMMGCQALLTSPFVDSVIATHLPEGDETRPGHWTITYNENSPDGAGERTVRWPTYAAGHMVAVSQPQQLFEDVTDFLREKRVIP